MRRVLLIGNQSLDVRNNKHLIGGPASYQVPIFIALGWEVVMVTRVGLDFSLPTHPRLKIFNLSGETTTFSYLKPTHSDVEDRVLVLTQQGAKISFLPPEVLGTVFTVVIVSGVAGEIDREFLIYLEENLNSPVVLDLQSIVRTPRINEPIAITPLTPLNYQDLSMIEIMKGSEIEISEDLRTALEQGRVTGSNLVETKGSGTITFYGTSIDKFHLNTVEEDQIVDSTGSGDIFLAGLVDGLYASPSLPLAEAVHRSHVITSNCLSIEGPPTVDQIVDILLKNDL